MEEIQIQAIKALNTALIAVFGTVIIVPDLEENKYILLLLINNIDPVFAIIGAAAINIYIMQNVLFSAGIN